MIYSYRTLWSPVVRVTVLVLVFMVLAGTAWAGSSGRCHSVNVSSNVVLPDGSVAQVSIDFNALQELSRVAREEYGMGGAVQHGASTLPDEAFDMFPQADTVEVHLATGFQNLIYDSPNFPASLLDEINKHQAVEHQ